MPLTAQQAIDVWTTRGFAVRYAERAGGWVVFLTPETRAQIPPQPDPIAAIEAADAWLTAREDEATRRDLKRLVAEMQRGRYFHRSRAVEEPDGAGGTVLVAVFDIIKANGGGTGTVTGITGRRSVVVAWRDLAEILDAGGTP